MFQEQADAGTKFQARLKGLTSFIRALALNRTLKLRLSVHDAAATDGESIYLPYSLFFGDFDRRYALGIAAHEVGHCLYTDFDCTDPNCGSFASLSELFRLGRSGDFSLPLHNPDGTLTEYRLLSRFMQLEVYRKSDNISADYRNAVAVWREILNALEDARIERRFKADRPETAYVINAVYAKAVADAQLNNLPFRLQRYIFAVCLMAAAVISHSVKPETVDAFIERFSADAEEQDLLRRAQTLVTGAAEHAVCTAGGFMSAASVTGDLFGLTAALTDLFIAALEAETTAAHATQRERFKRRNKHADIASAAEDLYLDLLQNPQKMVRNSLQKEQSEAVRNYIDRYGLDRREITIVPLIADRERSVPSLLPLQEITAAQNDVVIPQCSVQDTLCRNLVKILYPPRSRRVAVATRRCGVRFDDRKAAFAAAGCVTERLFKARTVTLNSGLTQLAVIIDTSSSTQAYRDDYLCCLELLRKVLGKANPSQLLSSIYCFCDSGIARVKRVNEKFGAAVAARLCYTGFTPGFAALHYAMTELAASPAGRKLLLCLSDGVFTDAADVCAGFMGKDGAGINNAGIKLACIYVKTGENLFPDGFKPHYSQIIDSAADLPQAIWRAVQAIY